MPDMSVGNRGRSHTRPVAQQQAVILAATTATTPDVVVACDVERVVPVDAKLVRQILSNVVTNAVKYSPTGTAVNVHALTSARGLELSVRDWGIGISAEDQERLCEPFHRGSSVGAVPGYGLGLAITKNAVDVHAGTIRVESPAGGGTTFTVTLPLEG